VLPPAGTPPAAGGPPAPDHAGPAGTASGALVLRSLVDAGLLQEGPADRYRVHDLLRLFVKAAGTHLTAPAPHDPTDLRPSAVG
jgi:SARP family transcriptional regulator, regulator of embCAB operon